MGRAVFSVILAAIGGWAMACESFSDAPSGGSDAGGELDGAGGDAGSTDGGDSGGPTRLCTGTERFTDSFDRATPSGNGWADLGGKLAVLPEAGIPPPALFVATPPLDGTASETDTIGRTILLAAGESMCVELDIFLEQLGSFTLDSYAEILDVKPDTATNVFVELRSSGLALVGNGEVFALTSFTFGAWQHLVLRMPFGASPAALSVDRETTTLAAALTSASKVAFELGIDATGRSGAAPGVRMVVDNVRVTTGL